MATDAIFESVAIRRELIEGVSQRKRLAMLMGKYVSAAMYSGVASGVNAKKLRRLHDAILRQMTKDFLPFSRAVGKAAASPILDELPSVIKGTRLSRRRAINSLRTYSRNNLAQFAAKLNSDVKGFSDSARVAFAEAARDKVAKTTLIDQMVAADRAEQARYALINREIDQAAKAVQDAEESLASASNRGRARARKDLRASKRELSRAKGKLAPSRMTSFYVRMENAVQGAERDAMRRESEMAMRMEWARRGYTNLVWVAVNGSDACPSCTDRHGGIYTQQQAAVDGPGAGGTYCGGACMCVMVPEEYAVDNVAQLEKPLIVVGRQEPRGPVPTLNAVKRSTGRPPAAIKLGGKNAELAKRAKKRAGA